MKLYIEMNLAVTNRRVGEGDYIVELLAVDTETK